MFLDSVINKFADNLAIITDKNERLTYQELFVLSDELYSKIGDSGLVFCLCQNSVPSLIGYVSCINNKIVPLLLDASLNEIFLKQLITVYRPRYLWLPTEKTIGLAGKITYTLNDYSLLQIDENISDKFHDDLALLLATSGSTGSPKLVRLSYNNVYSNAKSIAQYLEIDEYERPITVLPMHYSFGLSIINSHLLKGSTLLLTNKSLMEKDFWTFLKTEKATSLSGVPYTYEMLKRLRFFRMDLPFLKTLTQAGGKLSTALCREFAEYGQTTGKHFIVMYGQTEATARMSYLPPEQAISKAGSIGIAIPGGKFDLVDNKRQLIENSGQSGELVYQGTNVSLGYAESVDDLAKGDENKGILYTGDLAQRDDDGYYYIVGRKKRFIKLFGNRVNLDETESVLKSLYGDCACVGTDDKMIIYTVEEGKENEIKQFISTKTNIHFSAFEVRYISSIPKNTSGKTVYTALTL
jgi:acyl-CoA synthetase (AMP-forming)/AMP-acid ligase II